MRRRAVCTFVAPVAFALALAACGPNRGAAYTQTFAAARRAESAGRFAEAAERYDAAAREAKVSRDAENAQLSSARMLARSGNIREATTRLATLARSAKSSAAEDAEFQLAEMALARGDEAEGLAGMERFVRAHPTSGLARPALARILRQKDVARGERETIDYLRTLTAPLGATALGETIAYAIALRLANVGDAVAARDAFLDVATRWPYPHGKLFDDALYRASEIDEALGRHQAAVDHLERMLKERETTTFLGSYQRPRYAPALLRMARLQRDRLHDNARARAAFHRLYAEFTTSTLRDDALWEEAALFRADRDEVSACATLATLVRDFPDSRFVACAVERCPQVVRPASSKAPTACPAYVAREPAGEPPSP